MGRVRGSGLLKWGIVPVLCGLLGYAFVGPHFAARTKAGERMQEEVARVLHHTAAPVPDASPAEKPPARERSTPDDYAAATAPAPTVSVGVKPVDASAPDDAPAPRPRRHRRWRRRRATSDEAPPEATPAPPERTAPDPASAAP